MKINEHTALVGPNVVLVPYRPVHVQVSLSLRFPPHHISPRQKFTLLDDLTFDSQTYHEWMSSPELLELTASEPLSLDEEYDMQRSWKLDEDKLTFIILARSDPDPSSNPNLDPETLPTREEMDAFPMIGDVNMFLKGVPSDEDFEVEVEIMIAEPSYRRKGHASEALQLILSYTTSSNPPTTHSSPFPIHPSALVVRIGDLNTPSIRLFEKLGFTITKHVEVFSEVEMRLRLASLNFNGEVAGDGSTDTNTHFEEIGSIAGLEVGYGRWMNGLQVAYE